MSQIRKNSLKATTWIYIGFLIGALNTYFLTHKSWFSTDQNGLTRTIIDLGQLVFAFSSLGTTSFLFKFFPYYQDNLDQKKNDMLSIALLISMLGFASTAAGLFLLKPLVIQKFSANSIMLVEYFYWIIPMGFFILLYNVLEAYSLGFQKGVLTSLLKETILRLYTLVIIVLKILGFINFHTFIALFCFQYAIIVIILVLHLKRENKLWISFSLSRVTLKFRKKIIAIMVLTFFVIIVNVLRQSIDGLVLAAKQNLGKVGIFGLASYMVSILQAPFRSLVAITIPILARAWKDKNQTEILRIYQRTSINMLAFSLFVFFCIWLNFDNGIQLLHINPDYLEAKWVFFILGIVAIIELGTGVNSQIIGTSTFWRFELWTSLLLTLMIIPLSYILTVKYGILGPALANLISFSVYNFIRFSFLWKKFQMQPFTGKTLELIGIALLAYVVANFTGGLFDGILSVVVTTTVFGMIFLPLFYWRDISPDVKQLMQTFINRLQRNKQ